jgi:hypothetical protein
MNNIENIGYSIHIINEGEIPITLIKTVLLQSTVIQKVNNIKTTYHICVCPVAKFLPVFTNEEGGIVGRHALSIVDKIRLLLRERLTRGLVIEKSFTINFDTSMVIEEIDTIIICYVNSAVKYVYNEELDVNVNPTYLIRDIINNFTYR